MPPITETSDKQRVLEVERDLARSVTQTWRHSFSASPILRTFLFLLFLGLKLLRVIDWSWWWVTSPLWIPLAAFGGFALLFFAGAIGTLLLFATWAWWDERGH
jgi:hypothetical protein